MLCMLKLRTVIIPLTISHVDKSQVSKRTKRNRSFPTVLDYLLLLSGKCPPPVKLRGRGLFPLNNIRLSIPKLILCIPLFTSCFASQCFPISDSWDSHWNEASLFVLKTVLLF
ncbi:hypothetical protein CEXT_589521 [Caerostris extrusa]|uniref:Uncharacterized protein n=1 Tax=Caerostris extrusa TaxID=172846 RepID=A0AAV4QBW5_CAEEX|nr:hypothetical protein CEXT_589521 [Caerostris extrusa]